MAAPPYRVTLAMPLAAVTAEGSAAELASWLNAQLGRDTCPGDLGPPLSANGHAPASHHWCSSVWMEQDARSMLGHLADLGGTQRPSAPQWNGWTLAERCAWANEVLHPAMLANAAGGVLMEDASGESNPFALLPLMGLATLVDPTMEG